MKRSIFAASRRENSSTKPLVFTFHEIHEQIMEREVRRRKSRLLKYLPRAASAVSFQNPVYSPGRDKQRFYSPAPAGFSGPIVSIVPDEARRRPRRGVHDDDEEPTSPKVSCIGQIKLHKEKKKKMKMATFKKADKNLNHDEHDKDGEGKKKAKPRKQDSKMFKLFGVGFGSRVSRSAEKFDDPEVSAAPSLGEIRRFSSGRQALANFDWTSQIAPMDDSESRNCHSDDEFGSSGDEGGEREVIIPHSAPIVMGSGYPKAEHNLWQRRNTADPSLRLQLTPIRVRT